MKKEVIILLVLLILPIASAIDYETNPKEITLDYILNGEEGEIDFIVYGGVANYLASLPESITYMEGEEPSLADFKLKHIDEEIQKEYLLPLIDKIKKIDKDKIDQMRIAVNIIQNIEYGKSDKITSLNSKQETEYSRWPYEVLYDEKGICGEKSELLVFILKELDYGVGMFRYLDEDHEVVALKCPDIYGVEDTGYCFIETTGPSIVTDDSIEYVDGIKLESSPMLIELYGGDDLDKGIREYKDAKLLEKIRNGKFVFFKKWRLNRLNKKYGLVEEYNIK